MKIHANNKRIRDAYCIRLLIIIQNHTRIDYSIMNHSTTTPLLAKIYAIAMYH